MKFSFHQINHYNIYIFSSYTNGKNDLPMVHSSTSIHSYRNSSKILTHKSFDCINDNQEEDVHKYSETDSLLPKKEINAVIVGSTTLRYVLKFV